jgi:hypothetical protein
MNSNGDKSYTKVVYFIEIYNFVEKLFQFETILMLK